MKAVGLISGGLDSALAARIIRLQGVEVLGINFITPFTQKNGGNSLREQSLKNLAQNADIRINAVDISSEYLDLVKNPCFGFGRNMNPCIDCHIFMLKKAREFMRRLQADFIITGDVLGQRPMSQNRFTLAKIESKSNLEGLLLRPLSARLLPETIPERKGEVKRSQLFAFSGRSRKPQMELAGQLGLKDFSQPAGGCLLTDPGFSRRLKDLLTHQREFGLDDVRLLKLGRHFRLSSQAKLILGRNQQENQRLINFTGAGYSLLEPIDIPGPTGVLKAKIASRDLLTLSAKLLARYCDGNNRQVRISVEDDKGRQIIECSALGQERIEALRV